MKTKAYICPLNESQLTDISAKLRDGNIPESEINSVMYFLLNGKEQKIASYKGMKTALSRAFKKNGVVKSGYTMSGDAPEISFTEEYQPTQEILDIVAKNGWSVV